jgi:hypothetical protein
MPISQRRAQFGLSKAERDKIAASDFCGPDSSFPVDTQAHATAAWNLAGHAANPETIRACVRRKAKAKGFTLPDTAKMALSFRDIEELLRAALQAEDSTAEGAGDSLGVWIRDVFADSVVYQDYDDAGPALWQRSYTLDPVTQAVSLGEPQEVKQETQYVPLARMVAPAAFTGPATFSAEGEIVTREGPIFVLGDYPDRGISVDETAADAAIAAFSPVALELEHSDTEGRPSIFSGRLGTLESVWRKGAELWGRVSVPRWVDDPWGEYGRKVSTVWDIPSKTIEGCGLVLNPRVSQAALFAGKRHSTADLTQMQQIHDITVDQGATCAAKMSQEVSPMPEKDEKPQAVPTGGAPAPDMARFTALEKDNVDMQRELAQLRAERRHEKAAAEIQRIVRAGHILPVKEAVSKFTLALEGALVADERQLATFSQADGSKVSFATTLVAGLEALPVHGLTEERVPAAIFGGGGGDAPAEADEIKASREAAEEWTKQHAGRNGAS